MNCSKMFKMDHNSTKYIKFVQLVIFITITRWRIEFSIRILLSKLSMNTVNSKFSHVPFILDIPYTNIHIYGTTQGHTGLYKAQKALQVWTKPSVWLSVYECIKFHKSNHFSENLIIWFDLSLKLLTNLRFSVWVRICD